MQRIVDFVNNLPPAITAALMAVVVAVLRVIYDREETRPIRILMESSICGLLAVASCSAISALGVDQNWMIFVGSLIGYIGSNKVKAIAIKFIELKTDKDKR